MEAILFVSSMGCQWKALNATRFCPSSTAHDRFQEWVKAGVFQEMWKLGLMAYDDGQGIDWKWLSMDGCMTKRLGGKRRAKTRPIGPSAVSAQPVGGRERHSDWPGSDGANRNDMKMARPRWRVFRPTLPDRNPIKTTHKICAWTRATISTKSGRLRKNSSSHTAHSCAWRGSPEDQTEGSGQSTAVGGGTDTQLDESVSVAY